MSIKSVKRNPDFVLGWARLARVFQVSERTIRRWAEKAEINDLYRIKTQVAVPKEHLYFFWLRVCRHHTQNYHQIAMASAGHVLMQFIRKKNHAKAADQR